MLLPLKSSGRFRPERSVTALTPNDDLSPGVSNGRAVLMLIVAPIPPVGRSALEVLLTSTAAMDSEARLAKSNERELETLVSRMLAPGIWRPFSSTRL